MAITITAPSAGSNVSGTVSVVGSQSISTVVVSDGATQLGSQVFADVPFSISVDTAVLANGAQTLAVNDASVTVNVSNGVAPGYLNVDSVASPVNAQFNITGESGSTWVNVAAWDHATGNKISNDVTPSGGTFTLNVNLGTLTGTRQIDVIVFSVPAGQSGGTQLTVSTSVTVAAVVVPPAAIPFYGVNCHHVQGGVYQSISLAQQVSIIQNLNCKAARQDAYTIADLNTLINTVVPGMAPIVVIPVFIPTVSGTATAAYNTHYSLGQQAATAVMGKVPFIEFGNEWDLKCITNSPDGTLPSHYSQTKSALYIAAMAGFTQGFRNVDTTSQTLVGINGTYIHFGWLKMIVQNTLPNGAASGRLPIVFDIVTWHDYLTGGDMDATVGPSGTVNIFDSINALTTKPIYISECGAGDPGEPVSAIQAYIPDQIGKMLAHPQVNGVNWYELFDYSDGIYGLYDASGHIKPQGTTLKNFIAANPK